MAQFIALASNVEVNGETVQSFLNNMGGFQSLFEKVLLENGINDPKPGEWYLQQSWLNAFKIIAEKTGPATLKTIGRQIIDSANWPANVDNVEKALASIDVAYHLNHRKGEIGHYRFEKVSEREARIVCDNPYPCAFDMGVIDGAARKFATPQENPLVVHEKPDVCRAKGGDVCNYLVSW